MRMDVEKRHDIGETHEKIPNGSDFSLVTEYIERKSAMMCGHRTRVNVNRYAVDVDRLTVELSV